MSDQIDEPRAALVQIDRRWIARLLQFPEDAKVAAMHIDPRTDSLLLRVEGPMFEVVREGCVLHIKNPTYGHSELKDGSAGICFLGFGA